MKYLYVFLVFVPIALILEYGDIGSDPAVFVTSALAMIPLAAVLGRATEETAVYTGPRIGGLLNATLGNAAELIITIVALREGLVTVVKASIAGSIIGNILIVLGFSAFLGGLKHGTQYFDPRVAGTNATMMTLAVVVLTIPAVFSIAGGSSSRMTGHDVERLSDLMAVVLIVLYGAYLAFSIFGHGPSERGDSDHGEANMPLRTAILLLAVSTGAIVVLSEILVGAIEPTAESWGLSDLFIGIMLVPLIGNVAEHFVAVQVAIANKMELSISIAVGSGLQIALFVTPLLVFIGLAIDQQMTLVFSGYELAALIAATAIAVLISMDGESTWLEGFQLISLYAILGLAFYFVP
jgi:Ca2+:H+ antiporter